MLAGVLLLSFAWPVAGAQAATGDWAQFQQDEQRSGQLAVTTAVVTPCLAWSKYISSQDGTGVENTAIVHGSTVYVFAGSTLTALSRATGSTIWEQDIGAHGTDQIATPAFGDGKIFIATFDGWLMAFDAASGTPLWSDQVSQQGFQCPVTYSGGYIYVGDGGTGGPTNSYYCLDENGNLIWKYTSATAGYLWCGCSVIGDYLVFGNHEGVVTSVYRDTGAVADQVYLDDTTRLSFARATPGMIRASVAYSGGYIYATSENGDTEGYLWKIGFDQTSGRLLDSGFSDDIGFSTSTPVVYNGYIYVGQGEHGCPGSLVCVDDAGGGLAWSFPVESGVKASPVLMTAGGEAYLYFTTAMPDGFLYCLSGDGQLVWKYNLPDTDYVMQGPAAADGCLYQGDSSGYLYCFQQEQEWPCFQRDEVNSGVTDSAAPIQAPGVEWQVFTDYRDTHGIDHSATLADGKVFVDDVDDVAWAFDQASGQTLWSTQLDAGIEPDRFNLSTPAVGDGKVFIATCHGYIYALDENSGQILWSGLLTSGSYQDAELATQIKYDEGKVYVGSYEGNYFCLDANGQNGAPLVIWEHNGGGANYQWYSGAAVVGDYLLFGDSNSVITAVYKDTGVETAAVNLTSQYGVTAGAICSAIDYNWQQQQIYLTSKNGYAWSLGFDPRTGQFDTASGWHTAIGATSTSTPAVYDGQVYVCSGGFDSAGGLYCLSATDGSVLWQHDFGNYGTETSPAVSVQDGSPYIYVSADCQAADAYCFDGNGNELWKFTLDEANFTLAGVSIAGGRVFYVNDSGYLYALGQQAPANVNCDLNGDGKVDVADMVLVSQHFGETGVPGWIPEDVLQDGVVNVLDLILVGQHFTS